VELVDQAGVRELLDGVRSTADPDVPAAGGLAGLSQGALDPVVDKVEDGPAGSFQAFQTRLSSAFTRISTVIFMGVSMYSTAL
jgi:hypothetical protein